MMIIMTVTKEKTMKPSVERRRKMGEFNGRNNVHDDEYSNET